MRNTDSSPYGFAQPSFTLVELILIIVLIGVIMLVVSASSLFFIRHIANNTERYNMYTQVNYALEDIKLRSVSAIDIPAVSYFAHSGEQKTSFTFSGESNIYNITPDNTTDNTLYTYQVAMNGDLVLLRNGVQVDTLVEAKYSPKGLDAPPFIAFEYRPGDPPNVLRVTITAQASNQAFIQMSPRISRTENIRFWFITVTK